mgnify:FL=1
MRDTVYFTLPTSNKNYHIFETEFMASESFFNNTTFFHTTYGMFHFNPDSGNSPILLLFSSYKFFSLRFFWGMHTSMTFVCGAKPHNPKVSDTKQVVLYAMSFFTTITC